MRASGYCAAVLILAGCARKAPPPAVVPPPPAPSAPSSAPASAPPAASPSGQVQRPRSSPPRVVPSPKPVEPIPVPRQPPSLQSRTDADRDPAIIRAQLAEVRALLGTLSRQNLAGPAKENRDRVASMLDSAQKAYNAGNYRQADDLSSRAAMLAKSLAGNE